MPIVGFIPNREELAWSGGLFVGEGTVSTIGAKYGTPSVAIAMTDLEALQRFHAAIGGIGTIVERHPPSLENGRKRDGSKFKPQWRWRTAGFPSTQAVVAMLWPWLGTEKQEKYRKVVLPICR